MCIGSLEIMHEGFVERSAIVIQPYTQQVVMDASLAAPRVQSTTQVKIRILSRCSIETLSTRVLYDFDVERRETILYSADVCFGHRCSMPSCASLVQDYSICSPSWNVDIDLDGIHAVAIVDVDTVAETTSSECLRTIRSAGLF